MFDVVVVVGMFWLCCVWWVCVVCLHRLQFVLCILVCLLFLGVDVVSKFLVSVGV